MSRLSVAYLLCALTFFGAGGLHRFYLGKPWTGLLWFFTGGGFLIGTLYDLFHMEQLVAEAERKALGVGTAHALPQLPPRRDLQNPAVELELRLLKAAQKHGGRLTAPLAAAEVGVSIDEVDKKLGEMVVANHAEIDVNDDGVVIYDFPALRIRA
jgi:TM2 domain-containing membrane protein YozV